MQSLVIRRFEEKDLDQTYDMIHKSLSGVALNKVYDKELVDLWHQFYSKQYLLYCAKTKHFYVALLDNNVVGSGAVSLEDNTAYISLIYTDPSIQGKGIGREIINAIEKDDISLKSKYLYMHAALSAIKFYQKLGYKFKEEIPDIIVDCGLDMVHMEKYI